MSQPHVLSATELLREAVSGQLSAHAKDAGRSVVVGLLGRGIGASRSPVMHQREGARLGMSYSYVLVDFDRVGLPDRALGEVLSAGEALGLAGVNVTHPFKQAVVSYLTDLAPEAAAIGAVNTVVFDRGRRFGHNTDSWGFAQSFRDSMSGCALDRVVQFGAGGGGAAVAHALLQLGVQALQIIDTDARRAEDLAAALTARFGRPVAAAADPDGAIRRAAGVVNATPIGMDKYPGMPFPSDLLTPHHWVADIVYFPQETELLQRAARIGCRTLPGRGMAVYQAARAFELFTGIAPDAAAMTGHFGSIDMNEPFRTS